MDKRNTNRPAASNQGAGKILAFVSSLPLILLLTGAVTLAYGWFGQAETAQTTGAIIAGIGCVAMISRFLRRHAGK